MLQCKFFGVKDLIETLWMEVKSLCVIKEKYEQKKNVLRSLMICMTISVHFLLLAFDSRIFLLLRESHDKFMSNFISMQWNFFNFNVYIWSFFCCSISLCWDNLVIFGRIDVIRLCFETTWMNCKLESIHRCWGLMHTSWIDI